MLGGFVGRAVGRAVGCAVGRAVGAAVGAFVGTAVGGRAGIDVCAGAEGVLPLSVETGAVASAVGVDAPADPPQPTARKVVAASPMTNNGLTAR